MTHPTAFDVETESPSEDCPCPGIYNGVAFTEYCEWDAVNHSRLQRIDKSPLHCIELPSMEKSAAIRLGQLVHCGRLEPDSVDARYAVMPQYELSTDNVDAKGNLSTSVATTWCKNTRATFEEVQKMLGKTIVSQSQYDQFQDCMRAIMRNESAANTINESKTEVSIVWHDKHTGLRCKARLDVVHRNLIGDLKTAEDSRSPSPLPISFEYSLKTYNYYSQASFYQSGWEAVTGQRLPFWFFVVTTTPPIQCIAAPVGEMTLRIGRDKNQERLALYAQCKSSGVWPGYSSPELFELPDRYFESEDE
jgi:hypothetical protein